MNTSAPIRSCYVPTSRCFLFFTALFALISAAFAQSPLTGSISGSVRNDETKASLEGAEVVLTQLSQRTTTDRDGSFTFTNVPPGEHAVEVYYTGLDRATERVRVAAGAAATVSVSLKSEIYRLGAMVVSSDREGNAAAITKQRLADNLVNVVSMDAFGNVADGNIGNFLVRLPGVDGNIENGEVTGIRVRGTPQEFNALNVDGVRAGGAFSGAGAAGHGDRGAQIDNFPAEFIKEVELTKAPRPEHSADSIGGAVNLITKSALDFKESILRYRFGVNYNMHREDRHRYTPNGALTWLTRVGPNKNIGMALSLSYSHTEAPRDGMNTTRNAADLLTTQARTLTNVNQRKRIGSGLKFDYQFDQDTSVYLKLSYNVYKFDSPRTEYNVTDAGAGRVADYSRVSRAQIEAGTIPRTTANLQAGVAPGYTDKFTELLHANWVNSVTSNIKTGRNYGTEIALKKSLPYDQHVNFQATYNPSSYESDLRAFNSTMTAAGIGLSITTIDDFARPQFRQTYGPGIGYGADLSRYIAEYRQTPASSKEKMVHGKADYQKDFKSLPVEIQFKTGVAYRHQDRWVQDTLQRWNLVGADRIAGRNPATGINDDNLAQFRKPDKNYTAFNSFGMWPDLDAMDFFAVYDKLQSNPEIFASIGDTVTAPPNYRSVQEDVYAAYAQTRFHWRKLNILGGVRFEGTEVSATGRVTDARNPTFTRTSRDRSYHDYFPSIHLRYELTRSILARASFSTGAARPNMSDMYPVTTVAYNDTTGLGTVNSANPGLKPQFSKNTDFSLEWYFEPAGMISAGWFKKDITDYLNRSVEDVEFGQDNGFNGLYQGFMLVTTTNLNAAKVEGWEFNYNQRLVMLPKPFNGLRVFANYTKLKTEGKYSLGVAELTNFVPESGNAGLSMLWRKLEAGFTYNYTSQYLTTASANVNTRRSRTAVDSINLNFIYSIRPQLGVFFDVINVGDEWPATFTGADKRRVVISEDYGRRINLGVTGRF